MGAGRGGWYKIHFGKFIIVMENLQIGQEVEFYFKGAMCRGTIVNCSLNCKYIVSFVWNPGDGRAPESVMYGFDESDLAAVGKDSDEVEDEVEDEEEDADSRHDISIEIGAIHRRDGKIYQCVPYDGDTMVQCKNCDLRGNCAGLSCQGTVRPDGNDTVYREVCGTVDKDGNEAVSVFTINYSPSSVFDNVAFKTRRSASEAVDRHVRKATDLEGKDILPENDDLVLTVKKFTRGDISLEEADDAIGDDSFPWQCAEYWNLVNYAKIKELILL